MRSDKDMRRARRARAFGRGEQSFVPRRRHVLAQGTWHETVTHYTPEPWLVALERDRTDKPVRPGHRPSANR